MSAPERGALNLEAVRDSARANAPDRYAAALFAPAACRDDLVALAAFTGEIERVARAVSEAALGEIRVAWWREAFLSRGESGLSGNPVLDAFADVIRRRALPLGLIESYLEAHAHALHGEAPADDAVLWREVRIIDGTPFALATEILGFRVEARAEDVLDAAARAAGATRIAVDLPYSLMRGRSPLPADRSPNLYSPRDEDWRPQIAWLAEEARAALAVVRRHLAGPDKAFITAFLPLALVEPYFRALQKPRQRPDRDIVEIAALARLWRIARAHWSGRI